MLDIIKNHHISRQLYVRLISSLLLSRQALQYYPKEQRPKGSVPSTSRLALSIRMGLPLHSMLIPERQLAARFFWIPICLHFLVFTLFQPMQYFD